MKENCIFLLTMLTNIPAPTVSKLKVFQVLNALEFVIGQKGFKKSQEDTIKPTARSSVCFILKEHT